MGFTEFWHILGMKTFSRHIKDMRHGRGTVGHEVDTRCCEGMDRLRGCRKFTGHGIY